jgi:hypothetical protein
MCDTIHLNQSDSVFDETFLRHRLACLACLFTKLVPCVMGITRIEGRQATGARCVLTRAALEAARAGSLAAAGRGRGAPKSQADAATKASFHSP